jgi:hypothetical protein
MFFNQFIISILFRNKFEFLSRQFIPTFSKAKPYLHRLKPRQRDIL